MVLHCRRTGLICFVNTQHPPGGSSPRIFAGASTTGASERASTRNTGATVIHRFQAGRWRSRSRRFRGRALEQPVDAKRSAGAAHAGRWSGATKQRPDALDTNQRPDALPSGGDATPASSSEGHTDVRSREGIAPAQISFAAAELRRGRTTSVVGVEDRATNSRSIWWASTSSTPASRSWVT